MVKIKYYGILKPCLPSIEADGFWHAEVAGKTIGEVLDETGASKSNAGKTLLVNAHRVDTSYVLKDGDTLTVMPLVAGG